MTSWIDRAAQDVFFRACRGIKIGQLTIEEPQGMLHIGPDASLNATLTVHHPRVFRRALTSGIMGFGESYVDGDWDSPDLVALLRLTLQNLHVIEGRRGALQKVLERVGQLARALRDNTRVASRRNIHRHYDLGNEFFELFLDANLLYSCACFEEADDTLEIAQLRKLDRICQKLQLGPDDHVLEIGTGWGGFAVYAATRYGCRVTTTTISGAQHRYAARWFQTLGESSARLTLLDRDYRDLAGRYDKLVSIEMFEAVGLSHYDEFFAAVDRLLEPDGTALLQTIIVDDQRFAAYRAAPDWIERYIFPGAELTSVGAILQSLARTTDVSLFHLENIGSHYALTLRAWRERFTRNVARVRALGFDNRFIRMWTLYLAYCEAAFAERYIGDVQLLLSKNRNPRPLFGDPPARRGRLARDGQRNTENVELET